MYYKNSERATIASQLSPYWNTFSQTPKFYFYLISLITKKIIFKFYFDNDLKKGISVIFYVKKFWFKEELIQIILFVYFIQNPEHFLVLIVSILNKGELLSIWPFQENTHIYTRIVQNKGNKHQHLKHN